MRIDFGNFRIPAVTLVANEFIDRYMPSANGEYVKVYLYLLRHAGEEVGQAEIADALELTEGDVRRALIRWQRDGLLTAEETETAGADTGRRNKEKEDTGRAGTAGRDIDRADTLRADIERADTERADTVRADIVLERQDA